jgi:hypothetical protein
VKYRVGEGEGTQRVLYFCGDDISSEFHWSHRRQCQHTCQIERESGCRGGGGGDGVPPHLIWWSSVTFPLTLCDGMGGYAHCIWPFFVNIWLFFSFLFFSLRSQRRMSLERQRKYKIQNHWLFFRILISSQGV